MVAGLPDGRQDDRGCDRGRPSSGATTVPRDRVAKCRGTKVQVKEGTDPIHSRQKEELLVSVRGERVVIGVDEAAVNGALAGTSGFASTPFGQRIGQAFREGTGILFGIDLQSIVQAKTKDTPDKTILSRLELTAFVISLAEQKTFPREHPALGQS